MDLFDSLVKIDNNIRSSENIRRAASNQRDKFGNNQTRNSFIEVPHQITNIKTASINWKKRNIRDFLDKGLKCRWPEKSPLINFQIIKIETNKNIVNINLAPILAT